MAQPNAESISAGSPNESTCFKYVALPESRSVLASKWGFTEKLDAEWFMDKPMLNILWDQRKAQSNFIKHDVTFAQAATVILDPLAITVFDAAHSEKEDRWFTLGVSSGYLLLAVSHTYRVSDNGGTYIRLISARQATRKERSQYENVN